MNITYELEQYVSRLTFDLLDDNNPPDVKREEIIDDLLNILLAERTTEEVDKYFYVFDGDEWAKEVHKRAKKISDKSNRMLAVRLNFFWVVVLVLTVTVMLSS